MKKYLTIIFVTASICAFFLLSWGATTKRKAPTFEDAIAVIKEFEGLHTAKHWPLIGYGHKVVAGENYKKGTVLTEAQADKLLREDMRKLCAKYRSFGVDSLLLAALAYNCGIGVVAKSSIYSKLKNGNRDIETVYKAYCRYKGKVMPQIQRRREKELAVLFVKDPKTLAVIETFANDSTILLAEEFDPNPQYAER